MIQPSAKSDLATAQDRIAAAFDVSLLREAGHRLADALGSHMASVQAGEPAVLNWREPQANIDLAKKQLAATENDFEASELLERFSQLVDTMLSRGQNLHHPRYVGHQVPASVPIAGLFDAVGAVTNQVMAVYEMGPWATAVEQAMIEELGAAIGWPEGEFAGLVTHGGSLANLTGLLTARNVVLGDVWERGLADGRDAPVIVAHTEAHYSVARAVGILGIGTQQVIKAPVDGLRRIDPNQLNEILAKLRKQNRPIIAVSACACATPIGAFDPLVEIAEVCRRHDVWLHVDAAHGGSAVLSDRYRHLVAGLELADSVVWDAHKMLFVPALCAFVFYRDREHRFEAFRQDAPYLFDPSAPGLAEYDSGLKTIECTKRSAVFGLWGLWSMFGRQLFADMVDTTFDLGRVFYEKLSAADDFEPMHDPQCNIVAFRHLPVEMKDVPLEELGEFQLELRRRVIQSGEFYLVPTKKDGIGGLRIVIINPLTKPAHLDQLLDTLRETGRQMLRES